MRAQAVLTDFADVLTIDHYAAILHVVEALDQADQGRFAGPGRADDTDLLTHRNVQVEVLEHLTAIRVGEGHTAELDVAARQRRLSVGIVQLMWLHDDA